MKKRIVSILSLASLLSVSSCSSKPAQASVPSETASRTEEVPAPSEESPAESTVLKVKNFEKEVGENELEVDYPEAGAPELVSAVRTWINEQLGDTYRGNPDDAEAFFRHYASQLGTDPELTEDGGFTKDEFDLEYQDALVVTYEHASYIYEGGAHGMGGEYGTTFLKSDGSIFGKDCFTSYRPLMPLFIDGLKRYFKVSTDEELLGCLIGVPSLQKLSSPGMQPWIEEDGVTFSYTPYEIAPYSSGSPRFTIPLAKIRPYLNEKGLRYFQE